MNPDDFKSALLARLGLTAAPKPEPPPRNGQLLAAALGLHPAPRQSPPRPGMKDIFRRDDPGSVDFHSLVSSPFADTLRAITGAPSVIRPVNDLPSDATANYRGLPGFLPGQAQADTINLTPEALERDSFVPTPAGMPRAGDGVPQYVLAHEFGHRYDYEQRVRAAQNGNGRGEWAIDSVRAAGGMPSYGNYAARNRGEHAADAFANAVSYLRATDRNPDGANISAAELAVPGTFAVVQRLLREPIYAKHPLAIQQRMAVRPDATAVRKP